MRDEDKDLAKLIIGYALIILVCMGSVFTVVAQADKRRAIADKIDEGPAQWIGFALDEILAKQGPIRADVTALRDLIGANGIDSERVRLLLDPTTDTLSLSTKATIRKASRALRQAQDASADAAIAARRADRIPFEE